jgi:predicted DNA-binding transcriptional regulator AlpA
MESQGVFLSGPRVDARYGISAMTRWRWQHDRRLDFPVPMSINGRKLWRLSDLEDWERSRGSSDRVNSRSAQGNGGSEHPAERSSSSGQLTALSQPNKAKHSRRVGNTTC